MSAMLCVLLSSGGGGGGGDVDGSHTGRAGDSTGSRESESHERRTGLVLWSTYIALN